jgi:muramoyltetrapeptide carboxypeptidase
MNQNQRQHIFPPKARKGDQVRVLALSRSLGGVMNYDKITEGDIEFARKRLEDIGLKVTFGEHVMECNSHLTSSIESRIEDLHQALSDPSVKILLAVSGGIGAMQLLEHIDYNLFASNPKILCGYSDIGHIANAVFTKTGLVSYYGPNFSGFMMKKGFEYTMQCFQKCLCCEEPFSVHPSETWSDDVWTKDQENRTFFPNDGYWCISEGMAEGTAIGGNHRGLCRLQGSEFFPPLSGAILFLESPADGKGSLMAFDYCLRSLSFQKGFKGIRGIVIGRYQGSANINRENLTELVREIGSVSGIPIVANVDFGHTTPVMTIPIGGRCLLNVREEESSIEFIEL